MALDFENMPLSEMLYEASDQLAGDGNLFDMLLKKAKALEAGQPKVGRWMKDLDDANNEPFRIYGVKCTACKTEFDDGLMDPIQEHWISCPKCGASMILPL